MQISLKHFHYLHVRHIYLHIIYIYNKIVFHRLVEFSSVNLLGCRSDDTNTRVNCVRLDIIRIARRSTKYSQSLRFDSCSRCFWLCFKNVFIFNLHLQRSFLFIAIWTKICVPYNIIRRLLFLSELRPKFSIPKLLIVVYSTS